MQLGCIRKVKGIEYVAAILLQYFYFCYLAAILLQDGR